jgi:ATP/maltotriose-dependent transcriptional regulator MalT
MSAELKREMKGADALHEGRAAFGRRAWAEAYEKLSAADAVAPLSVSDLELLTTSAFLIGKDELSDDLWVRVHTESLRVHDAPRAARGAFWLINDLLTRGEIARAGGWLARAQRILEEAGHDCPECGLLLVMSARLHAIRGDARSAETDARRAVEIGDRFDDAQVKAFGRLALGQIQMVRGDTAAATVLFDEVMVAATVGDVSPIAVCVVYCAVIDACHHLFDIERAREWTAAFSQWCSTQPDLVPFRGQCLVHRAEIMRLSGAWSQATEEAERACHLLSRLADLRAAVAPGDASSGKYPAGAAFYELAEISRVRGDFARAEEAYRQASLYGQSPEPGLALLRLMQGRPDAAENAIRRVLDQPQNRLRRANALAASVEIMLAVRDLPAARAAAEELSALTVITGAPLLRASSARAMGSVLLAEGDARGALVALRAAWAEWQEIDAPYEAARVRVLMGVAYRTLGDDDAAELELDAARRVLERLGAAPELARVNDLVRATARPGARTLTPRELQVIGLIATGKTNHAIAQALSISDRTVDRHVSNILTKLDLSSRSAATAYAYEHGLV